MDMAVAHVICQSNNLAGAIGFTYGSAYGPPVNIRGSANNECTGYETSVSQCPKFDISPSTNCRYDYMAVDCSSKYSKSNFECWILSVW